MMINIVPVHYLRLRNRELQPLLSPGTELLSAREESGGLSVSQVRPRYAGHAVPGESEQRNCSAGECVVCHVGRSPQ